VTDDSLVKFRIVETVEQQLKKLNINPIIYTGVVPNPTTKVVNEIKEKYLNEKCDALISIGGGSAHDSAKGAALIISNKRNIYKCQGLNVTKTKSLMPIVAINTTAGTGSEVTNVAVITNEISHFKMTLVDKHIQPLASINDSNMMLGLPQRITS
jgi:alcohol dehydrogenase